MERQLSKGNYKMAKHTIEIEIGEDGIIRSEVHGILGTACETECKWLDSLGTVLEHKPTKDAFLKKILKSVTQNSSK